MDQAYMFCFSNKKTDIAWTSIIYPSIGVFKTDRCRSGQEFEIRWYMNPLSYYLAFNWEDYICEALTKKKLINVNHNNLEQTVIQN